MVYFMSNAIIYANFHTQIARKTVCKFDFEIDILYVDTDDTFADLDQKFFDHLPKMN